MRLAKVVCAPTFCNVAQPVTKPMSGGETFSLPTAYDNANNLLTPYDYSDEFNQQWRAFKFETEGKLVVPSPITVDLLLVGGGGAGGSSLASTNHTGGGGGGGAGEVYIQEGFVLPVDPDITVIPGAGASAFAQETAGMPTSVTLSVSSLQLIVGGGGSGGNGGDSNSEGPLDLAQNGFGGTGGAAGGGGGDTQGGQGDRNGGSPSGMGYNGGAGWSDVFNIAFRAGGGGGGFISDGAPAFGIYAEPEPGMEVELTAVEAGSGSAGCSNYWLGFEIELAAGGGGGSVTGSSGSAGGLTAGNGATGNENGQSAVSNSGSGGGGAGRTTHYGGDGGSGVVIVRFPR